MALRIGTAWQVLDDDGHIKALAPAPRPTEWLDVKGRTARLHRAPPGGILGDFDDQGLASAIRIGLTNRTITVPGQITAARSRGLPIAATSRSSRSSTSRARSQMP